MTKQQQINWDKLLTEALTLEGNIGNTYNRFYNYSFMNQVYLMMQGVKEPVATYNVWKKNGRQVKKGSKANLIVKPIFYKPKDQEDEEELKLGGFKPVKCIFGYSQTEGEDLPPVEPANWHIATACEQLNIEEVPFRNASGNTQGYSVDRQYAINPMARYKLKTTMHELAHIVLGHTSQENLHEYQEHRGLKEFQAEATAYLLMNELDAQNWDREESRAYIQNWLNDQKPNEKAIKQVFKAVNDILKAGKPEVAQ